MPMTEKEIQALIDSGELAVITECAYGRAVADSEQKNVLNKDKLQVTE